MPTSEVEVNTTNDFALHKGQNMDNHTAALRGQAAYVRQGMVEIPTFRTRQLAYRYAAWLISLAELLPDEEGQEAIEFETVLDAIRNA